jgi:DNA polymerase-4
MTVDRSMELEPAVLHVDMDAFFAAVELLDHPELVGKPVIVGGTGRRGVVASCTYEARRFGVHSAMPMFRARDLCPQAVVLPGRHDRYGEVSGRIHEVFRSVTPLVEPIGLDEAFLDVTGSRRLFGSPLSMAWLIRTRIDREFCLRCSVGVGRSKMIAKLASEAAKPKVGRTGVEVGEGVFLVAPDEELAFLHPMAVEALWGVGPATARRLHGLGVNTVGDLARVGREVLVRQLGRVHGEHLFSLAMASDPVPVQADRSAKSIGHEQTFPKDITDPAELRAKVVAMADALGEVLARERVRGRTVTLKVRFADFSTLTRSHTMELGIDAGAAIAAVAGALLEAVDLVAGVRLLGVSVSGLGPSDAARQLAFSLFPGPGDPERGASTQASWEEVARALAAIRVRFGRGAVGPASGVGARDAPVELW